MRAIAAAKFGAPMCAASAKEGLAWLQIRRARKRFESKEEAKEWAAQIKAEWTRNNFFALRKY